MLNHSESIVSSKEMYACASPKPRGPEEDLRREPSKSRPQLIATTTTTATTNHTNNDNTTATTNNNEDHINSNDNDDNNNDDHNQSYQ